MFPVNGKRRQARGNRARSRAMIAKHAREIAAVLLLPLHDGGDSDTVGEYIAALARDAAERKQKTPPK